MLFATNIPVELSIVKHFKPINIFPYTLQRLHSNSLSKPYYLFDQSSISNI